MLKGIGAERCHLKHFDIKTGKSEVANSGDTPTQPSLKHPHDPALTHDLACKGTMSIFELVDVYLCEKSYWWFVCESP